MVQAVLEREAPDPRSAVPGLNEDLVAVVLRCLRKDPASRYPSPSELREDCQALLDGRRPMHQVARNESETRREAQIEASERVGTGTGTRTRRLSQVRVKTSQVVVYVALAMTVVALVAVSMWPQSNDHRRSVADQSLPEADAMVGDAASRLPATGLGIRWRQSDERWQWSPQDAVAIVDGALQAEGGYVTSRSDQVSRVLAAWSGTDAASVVVELTSARPRAAVPEPLLTVQQNDGSPVLALLRLDDRLEVRLATNDVSLPPQIFYHLPHLLLIHRSILP